jgi:hypothetical protein
MSERVGTACSTPPASRTRTWPASSPASAAGGCGRLRRIRTYTDVAPALSAIFTD